MRSAPEPARGRGPHDHDDLPDDGPDDVRDLRRLLAPRSIAVVGGAEAEQVVRQCRLLGFAGPLAAVHPTRADLAGAPAVPRPADLPFVPDAVFVAVPAAATTDVVAALAAMGAGGAVAYASGFAEAGPAGALLQSRLVAAAAGMPVLGPNCYGFLNLLDGAALWPDVHGGRRVDRGVAIISQSGNVGLNLTMQSRALPLAHLVTGGNLASVGVAQLLDAFVDDERITAVGLHLEGVDDVAALSRAAVRAHERGLPVVALKTGRSVAAARAAVSHTSTLTGPDHLYDALFARLGIARVDDVEELLETLLLLHVHGGLPGRRIASASCSGGEASLVADLAQACRLELPNLGRAATDRLTAVLGDRVAVANPLDYHTYVWGDRTAMTECFTGLLQAPVDLGLLVLDTPRSDRCDAAGWTDAVEAFVAAQRATGTRAAVVSTLAENMPEVLAERLAADGVAPMRGLGTALRAVAAAAVVGAARTGPVRAVPGPRRGASGGEPVVLDEWAGKQLLDAAGLPVPAGRLVLADSLPELVAQAVAAAADLGGPVVVKAVGDGLAHKTETGAVALHLDGAAAVERAARRLAPLGRGLLVEQMVTDALAELVVGVRHDPAVGAALTVGAGGVLVELLRDNATLLLPVEPDDVRRALEGLRLWPLLTGHRGTAVADVDAVVDAVLAVARLCSDDGPAEVEVNPLLVLPTGRGVVAVDALVVR